MVVSSSNQNSLVIDISSTVSKNLKKTAAIIHSQAKAADKKDCCMSASKVKFQEKEEASKKGEGEK